MKVQEAIEDRRRVVERPASRRPLRICVLAYGLKASGGLWAGKNMVAALGRVAPHNNYLVIIPAELGYETICEQLAKCRAVPCDYSGSLLRRWVYETFRLPRIVRALRPEVILALGNTGLIGPPCPQAVLVRDAHFFYPASHFAAETWKKRLIKAYRKRRLRLSLQNTDLVFCQTSVAEKRFRRTFGYQGLTATCPNALSEFVLNTDTKGQMPSELRPHVDRMKLFYLAAFYAHKNHQAILETFRRFPQELEGVTVVVTVSADQHPRAGKFLCDVQRPGLSEVILNVGPMPQSSAPAYYRHCDALLMPTLLESFSATYLEAMHFGLPILTSDLDFAHAICGDAALYFDPWDPGSIKDAILTLKRDPELRRNLAARGKRRLLTKCKSWDEVATDVLERLTELVERTQR